MAELNRAVLRKSRLVLVNAPASAWRPGGYRPEWQNNAAMGGRIRTLPAPDELTMVLVLVRLGEQTS